MGITKGECKMIAIDTNKLAYNIYTANYNLSKSVLRLSENKKLATDHPSDAARSEIYKKYIGSSDIVVNGLKDFKEQISLASDATSSVITVLQKMRELAVTSTNTDTTDAERAIMNFSDFQSLINEVGNISTATKYKGTQLATGAWLTSAGKTITVSPDNDTMTITMYNNAGVALNFDLRGGGIFAISALSISSSGTATTAITAIDTAIGVAQGYQSTLNSTVNQLDDFINLQTTSKNNHEAGLSVIQDIDIASEMANYTKLSILQQASISMLAHGNLASQNILALLA